MDFTKEKLDLQRELIAIREKYEKFTKKISPKNWRTTGYHISELRKMTSEMNHLNEISETEKDIPWVKDALNTE